jgi:hypothetical protein
MPCWRAQGEPEGGQACRQEGRSPAEEGAALASTSSMPPAVALQACANGQCCACPLHAGVLYGVAECVAGPAVSVARRSPACKKRERLSGLLQAHAFDPPPPVLRGALAQCQLFPDASSGKQEAYARLSLPHENFSLRTSASACAFLCGPPRPRCACWRPMRHGSCHAPQAQDLECGRGRRGPGGGPVLPAC